AAFHLADHVGQRFGTVFIGESVHFQAKTAEARARLRPDRAQPDAFEVPDISAEDLQAVKKGADAVDARKKDPVKLRQIPNGRVKRIPAFGRKNLDRGEADDFRARLFQESGQFGRLLQGSRD